MSCPTLTSRMSWPPCRLPCAPWRLDTAVTLRDQGPARVAILAGLLWLLIEAPGIDTSARDLPVAADGAVSGGRACVRSRVERLVAIVEARSVITMGQLGEATVGVS